MRMRAALGSRDPSRFALVEQLFSVMWEVCCVLWLAELKYYTAIRRKLGQASQRDRIENSKQYFASCACGNSFTVRQCTTSLLLSSVSFWTGSFLLIVV